MFTVLVGREAVRRAMPVVMVVMLVTVVGQGTANGQDQQATLSLGGGGTTLFGDIGDSFGLGRNFELGVNVNLTEIVGLRFDYLYGRFREGRDVSLPAVDPQTTRIDATHRIHAGLFDVVVTSPTDRVKVYGLGGGGIYQRNVDLSTPGTGLIPGFCDPWWYVCYPPILVPVDEILASRSSTDFGLNVGGGMVFQVTDDFGVFVEGRYHYVWGPEIEQVGVNPLGGTPRKENANGTYFPFTFGIRFGG